MKLVFLFYSFFIFILPAQAIRPTGMYHPKNIALNLKKDKNHECNDRYKTSPENLSPYSFSTTIECQFRCKSDLKAQTMEVSRYFNPEKQGLKTGDGHVTEKRIFLSSFSTVFFNWSTTACIEEAIQKCGSIDRIKTADFKKISSGTWSTTEKPTCKNNRVIFSPYDDQYKLNKTKELTQTENKTKLTIPDSEESQNCLFPIKGEICFGDCVLFDENNESATRRPLILMSKDSPGNEQNEVCGDSLLKAFNGQSLSSAIANSICQNFYTSALVRKKAFGSTCAAFRGHADCSSFIKRMTR